MEKKEFYRHALPHFQQPGQAYFVTWSLKDALPAKALKRSKPFNSKQYIFVQEEKLENYAFCIMSNHIHRVFRLFEKDEEDNPVYLQDILQSVKRFSSAMINKKAGLKGILWEKVCFDSTILDNKHLYDAINYTQNNPVSAGFVGNWYKSKGTRLFNDMGDIY